MKKQGRDSRLQIVLLLLLLVTFAAYLPALRADFVNFDDEPYVTANPHVQSGLTWKEIPWAFNVGYLGNWHPLTWMSHMLDCQLFGLRPAGPHAVNLLLHLANTLLLLVLLRRVTGSLWRSAFVAALFAVHPMHVESVAWVAERKDVLSTLFWLLTMWAYVRYTEVRSRSRYAVVLVSFALGLMSKPTLVTLPLILLLFDYWPLGRWADAPRDARWRLVREKLPLFAMSAAASVVTFLAQQRGGGVRTMTELSLSSRLGNAPMAYANYIGKMLWPAKLAVFYPHPVSIPAWQVLAAVVLLVAVTVLVVRSAHSRPYLLMGWLWYLAVLVPMIGLVQVGRQAMADRYTYVSFIGLFVMIAWGVSDGLRAWVQRRGGAGRPGTSLLAAVSLVVIVVLAGCTWRQAGLWRDSVTLWKHALSVTGGSSLAYYNLGTAYAKNGNYAEAIEASKQAIRLNPDYADAYNNLGAAYGRLGKYAEAVEALKQAIRVNPNSADAHFNLGADYHRLGRFAEAADAYRQAIRLNPNDADAHYALGNACGELGRAAEAVASFKQAIRLRPDFAMAHLNLGITYAAMGDQNSALGEYRTLQRLDPARAGGLLEIINRQPRAGSAAAPVPRTP